MTNIINSGNYLRTSRTFPEESQPLSVELSKAYIDIANQVNNRISGVFGTAPSITGESWFINGQAGKQQTLREVYTFTSAGNIPHGLSLAQISYFTRIYGTFTDGTNWYPLPYVDVANATNQVNVYVGTTNVVIAAGAGSPPAITAGAIVLEWLSQF